MESGSGLMFDIIIMALAGVICGVFTGIIPGIHPNTLVGITISSLYILFLFFQPYTVAVFIITMGITHTFLSFIPSVFLGAPDETSTILSVLPGHKMLLEGRGYEAVYLTILGGIGVILLLIITLPLTIFILPLFYGLVKMYIPYILICVLFVMIWSEKKVGKMVKAVFITVLSGMFGILVFNTPISFKVDVLLPLFTGMFGLSTLIISIAYNSKMPKQIVESINVKTWFWLKSVVKGFLSGMIVGILPGIGPSQAAVVTHQFGRKDVREFLIALGGINTITTMFSLMALYLINKPRSGLAIGVQKIMVNFGFYDFLMLLSASIFATGLAVIITIKFARYFSILIQKVDYKKISYCIIIFLVGMTGLMSGEIGLLILFTSTAIGLLPPLFGIKRTHGMGVLIIPIILWFWS